MPELIRFRGQVVPHSCYYTLSPDPEAAKAVFEVFEDYWMYGFDPEVGFDAPLAQPKAIQDLAVCHAHLRPVSFSGDEFKIFRKNNPTKRCWDDWENGAYVPGKDAPSRKIPHSDEWLIYCVDSNRNACVLAHLQADAHEACKDGSDFLRNIMDLASHWFDDSGSYPMSYGELAGVFHPEWRAG